jgi:small-conductance mechanosensitive channel
VIQIGTQHSGVVEDITLRHTVIRNWENRRIIIPNSVISNETLINSSIIDEKTCRHLPIDISYDSDIRLARKIIEEEVAKHPEYVDVRTPEEIADGNPLVRTRVIDLGEYAVTIRAYLWAKDSITAFTMSTDLMESIKYRFDQEGIEIPFPYRTLVYKKDLPANTKTNSDKAL